MDSNTFYEYQRRINQAYNNKDISELKRIKEELESYNDPDAKKLVLSLHI